MHRHAPLYQRLLTCSSSCLAGGLLDYLINIFFSLSLSSRVSFNVRLERWALRFAGSGGGSGVGAALIIRCNCCSSQGFRERIAAHKQTLNLPIVRQPQQRPWLRLRLGVWLQLRPDCRQLFQNALMLFASSFTLIVLSVPACSPFVILVGSPKRSLYHLSPALLSEPHCPQFSFPVRHSRIGGAFAEPLRRFVDLLCLHWKCQRGSLDLNNFGKSFIR